MDNPVVDQVNMYYETRAVLMMRANGWGTTEATEVPCPFPHGHHFYHRRGEGLN